MRTWDSDGRRYSGGPTHCTTVSAIPAPAEAAEAHAERIYQVVFDALDAAGVQGRDERQEIADAAFKTALFRAQNPFVRLT